MNESKTQQKESVYFAAGVARKMVRNPEWLNLRAACVLASAAGKCPGSVLVTKGGQMADELLALGVEPGETIEVLAEGEHAVRDARHVAGVIAGGYVVEVGSPVTAPLAAFGTTPATQPAGAQR